ncbi:MAG: multicopper oxidase domain-containing protein, partial [Chloroflexota bacterium]
GRYECETFVGEVLLAPSERAVIDVLFDTPGDVRLEHRTPDHVYDLGAFAVDGAGTSNSTASTALMSYAVLRTDPELTAEPRTIGYDVEREPDKVLAFVASMPLLYGGEAIPASSYNCPMHPTVTSLEPGACPLCGMRLLPVAAAPVPPPAFACPMHPEIISEVPGTCPKCGMKLLPANNAAPSTPAATHPHTGHSEQGGHEQSDGLEWEDLMPEINRASNTSNMIWQLIDRQSGSVNGAITWAFTVGDRVKIRLVNEMESDHPMHHPFHIHGAGRFLILSRDGQPESNLVWKDTVLVRAGQTVDILLEVTNPGLWMAHCHIAEHAQSGMMFSLNVARPSEGGTS